MRLPFIGRRSGTPHGIHVPRGEIAIPGQPSLGDRLQELGVRVHDPLRDALEAGRFGTTASGGGLPATHVVAGDLPPGSKVTKAPSVVEQMQGDGFTWNGPEGSR